MQRYFVSTMLTIVCGVGGIAQMSLQYHVIAIIAVCLLGHPAWTSRGKLSQCMNSGHAGISFCGAPSSSTEFLVDG
jgi:hypothetical protein